MTSTRTSILTLSALALALGVGASSCARDERARTDSTHADSATTSNPSGTASGIFGAAPGYQDSIDVASPDTVSPVGGTLADLSARLRTEALRLDQAVRAGDLQAVTSRALRVRDLAVALNGKASSLPAKKLEVIEGDVSHVVQITDAIRIAAAAGDSPGVKTQNDQLQGAVARIVQTSASPA